MKMKFTNLFFTSVNAKEMAIFVPLFCRWNAS